MAQRAPRGSAKDAIGIYVALEPELYKAYVEAAAERDITTRELVVGALRRELADPSFSNSQGGLYDVA